MDCYVGYIGHQCSNLSLNTPSKSLYIASRLMIQLVLNQLLLPVSLFEFADMLADDQIRNVI